MNEEKTPIGLDGKEVSFIRATDQELSNPGDFKSPQDLLEELITRVLRYHPSADISMIKKAYEIGRAHV